jgi:hypothetical protein
MFTPPQKGTPSEKNEKKKLSKIPKNRNFPSFSLIIYKEYV